jgi:O-antigen ligase
MLKPNPLSASAGTHDVASTSMPAPGKRLPGSPAAALIARPLARSNVFHYLLLLHVFLFCTRAHEFIPHLRFAGPLTLLLLVAMGLMMRAGAILRMPAGRLMIAFTAWVGFCVPFSVWIGGSADLFERNVQALLTIVLMAAFIQTVPEAIRAMYTVGLSSVFISLMSFVAGWEQSGRLVLGQGTLSDPNYYCMYVLCGLPFMWLVAYSEPGLKRIAAVLLLLPVLLVVARTGSRGGLVALAAGLMLLFLLSPVKQKIYLSLAGMAMIIAGLVFLPDGLVTRFKTIFDNEGDDMALQSSAARKELFFRSLELTAQNPIVGVGPGMFTIGDAAYSKDTGRKAAWHATHNTYTELSSEVGIPGAVLFILALYRSYRDLSRVRRTAPAVRVRNAALFTQMSLVTVSAAACFLSAAYGSIPYVLIGIAGTFLGAVANEQRLSKPPAPAFPPAPRTSGRAAHVSSRHPSQHVITKFS